MSDPPATLQNREIEFIADFMFAKVIGASNSIGSLASALERTARALAEFQIDGLPTNLASLQAILARPELAAGDARTTLLAEHPELTAQAQAAPASGAKTLLDQQAAALSGGRSSIIQALIAGPSLDVRDGEAGVECPMAGAVVELTTQPGAVVAAGSGFDLDHTTGGFSPGAVAGVDWSHLVGRFFVGAGASLSAWTSQRLVSSAEATATRALPRWQPSVDVAVGAVF